MPPGEARGGSYVPPIRIGGGEGGDGSDGDDLNWLTQLIADVDQTGRPVTDDEGNRIRQIVAPAGFFSQQNVKPERHWLGRSLPRGTVQAGMLLDAAEDHYPRHTEKLRQ